MRTILFFIIFLTASTMQAQDKIDSIQFPSKGYTIRWPNSDLSINTVTIKKFKESDSLYYVKFVSDNMTPYSIFFTCLNERNAKIISYVLDKLNKKQRTKFIKDFLKSTHFYDKYQGEDVDNWTYFNAKVNERYLMKNFNLDFAIYAFKKEKEAKERWKNVSPEQWMILFQAAKAILPVMAAGADTRTLYDKVLSGGY